MLRARGSGKCDPKCLCLCLWTLLNMLVDPLDLCTLLCFVSPWFYYFGMVFIKIGFNVSPIAPPWVWLGVSLHESCNSSLAGIILGAKFIPWAIFRGFSPKKDSPFYIFGSPISPNFDGVNFFHPKNRQIII